MKVEFVETSRTLTCKVGGLDVARVTGIGTVDPNIETRNAKGGWSKRSSIDDRYAREYLREYADLATFIVDQVERRAR